MEVSTHVDTGELARRTVKSRGARCPRNSGDQGVEQETSTKKRKALSPEKDFRGIPARKSPPDFREAPTSQPGTTRHQQAPTGTNRHHEAPMGLRTG